MAVYTSPTETLPIFDNAVLGSSINSALTPTTGLSYFLSYPTAQGQETITSLQTTNIIANPTTTGDISVGTSQTSGFIKLGSITRSGIIYLGNVIFQQVSGVLSFSINSFTSLTTLNLFTGSLSGFSSGFTTVNFLQGTLFKDITANFITIPTISSDTDINQIINIGSGDCLGTGINNANINIGSYTTSPSSTNNAMIKIGNIGGVYTKAPTTQLTGRIQTRFRDVITNIDTTQNIYGYISYLSVITATATLPDTYNQNLTIVVSGSLAGACTITLMPLIKDQNITIRGIKTAGTGITVSSNGGTVNMYALASSTAVASITITITGSLNLYCNGTNWFVY